MKERPLAIITTRLPPAICGVGAHSLLLQQHWPRAAGAVEFLVVDGGAAAVADGAHVTAFGSSGTALARALERLGEADILLHYAARAYQRWGCPVWLPGAIGKWKRKFPSGRLLLFVHEAPGDLPFTSRHFWLGKVNGWILRRLASLADVVVTNTETQHRTLEQISRRDDIHVVPVGSNIEIANGNETVRNHHEFVIFGLPYGRAQTLRMFEKRIRDWFQSGRLAKLHIIGPEPEADEDLINLLNCGPSVIRHGALGAGEVSRVLQSAQFALTHGTLETWTKSGTFMACALHGCAPVIFGVLPGSGPLSCAVAVDEVETISNAELQSRADALRAWYRENADWPVVANRLATLLEGARR